MTNAMCAACQREPGVFHVTIAVDVFGPRRSKKKMVQFWLCANCETDSQRMFTRDDGLKARVAAALTNVRRLVRFNYGDQPVFYWTREAPAGEQKPREDA